MSLLKFYLIRDLPYILDDCFLYSFLLIFFLLIDDFHNGRRRAELVTILHGNEATKASQTQT